MLVLFLLIVSAHSLLHSLPVRLRSFALDVVPSTSTSTYIPLNISIAGSGTTKKNTLLVKSGEFEVLSEIRKLNGKGVDESKIALWSAEERVFWLNGKGQELLYKAEKASSEKLTVVKKTKSIGMNVDTYVDVGGHNGKGSVYVKSSRVNEALSGTKSLEELKRSGEAFSNLTELFVDYQITTRADNIATRMRKEFPIASPEWQRWTNNTMKYNTSSLMQVRRATVCCLLCT